MIKIKVPAKSATLGPGFDSLGVALNFYNNIYLEEYDSVDISSCDGSFVPLGEKNLIYKTVKDVYNLCGKSLKGLKLVEENPIPMARGLGSSSACIVSAVDKVLNSGLRTADISKDKTNTLGTVEMTDKIIENL